MNTDVHNVYIAARLFSMTDRYAAAIVAHEVDRQLTHGLSNYTSVRTFLPFRDTNQQEIVGDNKAAMLFKSDIDALDNSIALVALHDGVVKDSGVSMEIGYAFARSLPIILLTTDFMHECLEGRLPESCDPVIARMSSLAINQPQAGITKTDYAAAHIFDFQRAAAEAASALHVARPGDPVVTDSQSTSPTIYCDLLGGRFEWCRSAQLRVACDMESVDMKCNLPMRLQSSISSADSANNDLNAVSSAKICIFTLDTMEIDAAGGALLGFAYGLGKEIILINSANVHLASTQGQAMHVNLMLEQAATKIVPTVDDAIAYCKSRVQSEDLLGSLNRRHNDG